MHISLKDKVAIVTGASRGIGRAIAETLAEAGAAVVVNHRDSAKQAAETVAAIEARGGRAAAVAADMGVVADAKKLVDAAISRFGRLDIVVNNAGVGNRTAMADMTEKEFDWTLSVNARGPFFMIQAAVPRMSDGGRIVNIGGTAGRTVFRRQPTQIRKYGTWQLSHGDLLSKVVSTGS